MKKYAGLLILSWLIVATILIIAENSTSHQDRELTEEYEFHRKQDSLARINEIKELSEIYGQKKSEWQFTLVFVWKIEMMNLILIHYV